MLYAVTSGQPSRDLIGAWCYDEATADELHELALMRGEPTSHEPEE